MSQRGARRSWSRMKGAKLVMWSVKVDEGGVADNGAMGVTNRFGSWHGKMSAVRKVALVCFRFQ